MATKYNYVIGSDGEIGRVVKDLKVEIDRNHPMTLKRAASVFDEALEMSGRELTSITIVDIEYADGIKVKDSSYIYNKRENRLTIWRGGSPVYENADGKICSDQAALECEYL